MPKKPDGDTAPSEFDLFHDLASRLAKVPKEQIDEARERERQAKT